MKEVFTIETNNQNRALIAMSGGVDSSVAAYLMKQAGYECVGATMRLYENEDVATLRTGTCCSLEDVEDARAVAARLGMPYYVFNFKEDFGRQVMDRFVAAYEGGCTPNPCIDCNRYLKFDRMYRRARELGIGYVVTGHYARIQQSETGRWLLLKGPDPQKDQSYVLYAMTQEQLAHTQFPRPRALSTPKSTTARISALSPMGITPPSFAAGPAGPIPRATLWTQRAIFWDDTKASSITPSANVAAWASPADGPCMSKKFDQRTTPWYWQTTAACMSAPQSPQTSTGLPWKPPFPPSESKPGPATTSRNRRPPPRSYQMDGSKSPSTAPNGP